MRMTIRVSRSFGGGWVLDVNRKTPRGDETPATFQFCQSSIVNRKSSINRQSPIVNRQSLALLLMGCGLVAACSSNKNAETGKLGISVRTKRMVGELERLGKNEQDFLVLGLDAPGFEKLTLRQKALVYYLYRAAIAGHTIADQQNHRHAREIRNLLEGIYQSSEGMNPKLKTAVHDYLKYIWINHGPYDHDSHTKTLPNYLTPEDLKQAAEYCVARGLKRALQPGETLQANPDTVRPTIFAPDFEPIQTNQKKGDDIIATSSVNLYGRGLTQKHIDELPLEWRTG